MKKILAYICVVVGLVALACASYNRAMVGLLNWNSKHAMHGAWWGKHSTPWGDLTRMALLDDVKQFQALKDYKFTPPADSSVKNIELYVYGDSHTEDFPGYAFAHVNSYHYGKNTVGLTYDLDTTKHNILLIETTERFVRGSFDDDWIYHMVKRKADQPIEVKRGGDGMKTYSAVVNKNLEYLLFDYNFINIIRRSKANMNYTVFNRASGDVTISDNGRYLFFKPTTASWGVFSNYFPLHDVTIQQYADNFKRIYDHYRAEGFEEVYFSIIPNPASILQPEGYNGLIPRLRERLSPHVPYLDIYDAYRSSQQPDTFYRKGDTHWNNKGAQLWLQVVNEALSKKSRKIAAESSGFRMQ